MKQWNRLRKTRLPEARAFLLLGLLLIVLMAICPVRAQSQKDPNDPCGVGRLDYIPVIDVARAQLQKDLAALISRQEKLDHEDIPAVEAEAKKLRESLAALDADEGKSENADTPSDRASLKSQIQNTLTAAETKLGGLKAESSKLSETIRKQQIDLKCVQDVMATYSATPEQTFKALMSVIFACLIGLVILGFFVISYLDHRVRRAIFTGETGLQFVTLFSIVIAITLFGITGILQDKELAALLGGLSGYILGRFSTSRKRSTSPPDQDTGADYPSVENLEIAPPEVTLTEEKPDADLTVSGFDEDEKKVRRIESGSLTWVSSDPSVAVVKAGRVSWVGPGDCTVKVSLDAERQAACQVKCV